MVEQRKMPPADAEQPSDAQRRRLVMLVRDGLDRLAELHADDPGAVTIRRLTSAEYAYTIRDLTGLDLAVARDFVSDAVGGEGFTNVGDVQFMQDATLEWYLSAAKQVASHAVIGAGPLQFHDDPGQTGFELSAIARIQDIYRGHGFRSAAGEGGEAFGLDRYGNALFVAWRFHHRHELGLGKHSLASLARREKVDVRFAEHVWSVLTEGSRSSPTSDIVKRWQALPVPADGSQIEAEVRRRCAKLQRVLSQWQNRLGENPNAKEDARILEASSFQVSDTELFEMNINWPKGTKTAHVTFAIESADGDVRPDTIVIWQNPVVQFRVPDRVVRDPSPLKGFLTEQDHQRLKFGVHPCGRKVETLDFVTMGTTPQLIKLPVPDDATSARLIVAAKLDTTHGDGRVIRCTISQREETDQGKSVSALLADPSDVSFQRWKDGVLEFARLLPQISHREPAPSDRDPIPPPFDATYNNPERNYFHARVKYHRDDHFLMANMLDDRTRKRLDQAWFDLLGSFDYHDAYLQAVAEKYRIDLQGRGIAELGFRQIEPLAPEPRTYVHNLWREYHAIQEAFQAAQPGHVNDVLRLASVAWRRPLRDEEQLRLREFYRTLRKDLELEHGPAIRALLTRVLVAPAFLYRSERSDGRGGPAPLSNWELASRLSYFLWSSLPDAALRRAAAAGELTDPDQLALQARRMLRDPRARRLSSEFFGQWFGFYQFDRYRGVDPKRFPEFTDSLKTAMHHEAVSFFEHIIREDRPVREILFGDYAFLNRELADHYGVRAPPTSSTLTKVSTAGRPHRGGLFGLGAVLTLTSAPRRTSPVKRGDWILRRVLGTPVPPPPADAGSIPADDVLSDGKTLRQRLEAHRRDASCMNCHARIDPLGFTLENFDAVGRWRDRYRDGNAIDASGTLRNGTTIAGPNGLRAYLLQQQTLFHRTLCTKLVGYALGRKESIADVILIEKLMEVLDRDDRFSTLVEAIVRSKQFRYRR